MSFVGYPLRAQKESVVFGGFKVSSIKRTEKGEFKITGSVKAQNDSTEFSLKDIYGVICKKSVPVVEGQLGDIFVPTGPSVTPIKATVRLVDDSTFIDLLAILLFHGSENYTADIGYQIADSAGNTKTIFYENVYWKDFRHKE
jgi:hypothetical protein